MERENLNKLAKVDWSKNLVYVKRLDKTNPKEQLLFKGFTNNDEVDFLWIQPSTYYNFRTFLDNLEFYKNHITDKKDLEDFLYDYGFYDLYLDNEDSLKNEIWNYLNN